MAARTSDLLNSSFMHRSLPATPPAEAGMAAEMQSQGQTAPARRLLSLDALRGFDMFWIVGGEELIHALYKVWPIGLTRLLDRQMDHQPWAGVHFYDLIFPIFVFIVGTSLVFSLSRLLEQQGRAVAFKRILFRSALIYFFGLLVYGGISKGLDQVRWVGVLQRI